MTAFSAVWRPCFVSSGRAPLVSIVATALSILAGGCGGSDSPADDGCGTSGITQVCTCPDLSEGVQVCEDDGGWSACTCAGGDAGGGDTSGVDAGTDAEIDTAEDTGPTGDLNACGGTAELQFQESAASPGDSCGRSCGGLLVCNGPDALRCVGAAARNPCGGCGDLAGEPDTPCGPCNDGAWACADDGQVTCEGASEPNGCGGCAELEAEPAWQCEVEEEDGTWTCVDPDEVECVPGGRNACGGQNELDAKPGAPCGACGLGRWVCDDPETVVCDESDAPLNSCGGCAALAGGPGDACGTCGTWACAEDGEAVLCLEDANSCGGCGGLTGETRRCLRRGRRPALRVT